MNAKADILIGQQHVSISLDEKRPDSTDPSIFKALTEITISKPATYEWVKITPPEPFIKGTKLGAEILRIELTPAQ